MLGNHRERTFIIAVFVFMGELIFMMQGGSGIWWWDGLLNLSLAAVFGLLWDYLRQSGALLLTGLFAWMTLVTLSIALLNIAIALS
jgi:hypothetical protein